MFKLPCYSKMNANQTHSVSHLLCSVSLCGNSQQRAQLQVKSCVNFSAGITFPNWDVCILGADRSGLPLGAVRCYLLVKDCDKQCAQPVAGCSCYAQNSVYWICDCRRIMLMSSLSEPQMANPCWSPKRSCKVGWASLSITTCSQPGVLWCENPARNLQTKNDLYW